jgi:tRNA threonylcarbamoyl adenosine modification protein YjeE
MHFYREAAAFLTEARDVDPLLVLLRGDLGAGKTTFVKAVLSALGVPASEVQSPTFLKLLEHAAPGYGLCVHIDAYRIEDEEGFAKLALETYAEARAWFVEWPEGFESFLAAHAPLRAHLGFREAFEVELKLDPVPGSAGAGHPVTGRSVRWHRKKI